MKRRSPWRRGQAMIEYTMVTHVLLVGGAVAVWPFLSFMLKAFAVYYRSIYFVLSAPVP